MGSGQKVIWFGREIFLDEIYFVYFSDQKRELTKKQLEHYGAIKSWPEKMKWEGLLTLDPRKNPNITPLSGRQIMDQASRGYIPQFDSYFEKTRRLTLLPAEGMEYFLEARKKLDKIKRRGF